MVSEIEGAGDIQVIAGGVIPEEDKALLKQAGVTGIFGPGTNTGDIVKFIAAGNSAELKEKV